MSESESERIAGGEGDLYKERHLRYYSPDLKRRIVEETFAPGASVSIVARRHDVNSNLVFAWRKKYRQGELGETKPSPRATTPSAQNLIRVGVIDADANLRPVPAVNDSSASVPSLPKATGASPGESSITCPGGMIEIELPNRVKVRADASISEAALRRVLTVVGAPA